MHPYKSQNGIHEYEKSINIFRNAVKHDQIKVRKSLCMCFAHERYKPLLELKFVFN